MHKDLDFIKTPAEEARNVYGGVAASISPPTHRPADSIELPARESSRVGNWSDALQTVLDCPPVALPGRLLLGATAFSAAFVLWAHYGYIDEVGRGQGQLVPKGNTYKVHPVEAGKIVRLMVKEGDAVQKGQLLAQLDPAIAETEVDGLKEQLASYRTQAEQTRFLRDRAHLEGEARQTILEAQIREQTAEIDRLEAAIAATQVSVERLNATRSTAEEQVDIAEPLPQISQGLLVQLQSDIDAAQERVSRLQPLVERGAISRDLLFDAQQNLRDRQSALMRAQLQDEPQAKTQTVTAEQGWRDRDLALSEKEGNLNEQQAQLEAGYAQLSQKQAEVEHAQIEQAQKIQQLELEVTELHAKMAEAQTAIATAQTKLQQRSIYAPVDGTVSTLSLHHIGEVVQPGQPIAEIRPDSSPLVLSARLPDREAGFVKLGMPVQVKLDAYPYQQYGIIKGKVTLISPDAKPDPKLGEVYRVEVALDRNYVKNQSQTVRFKAGQTGSAEIVTRRRRIRDVILEPIQKMQTDGIKL